MFKLLHVWSSKEATGNEEKKKKKFAEPGWATTHLSIRLGARALGGTGARQAGAGRGRARGLGVLLGQWAVHSVHSACFWPGLTQYGS